MSSMIGIGIGIPFSRVLGSSFTPEYQAVLDRATALGYTLPSAGQQVLQNQLIVDLKAAGVWAKLDVFYVYANDAGSLFSTLNWKAPTLHQNTLVNSPTFTNNQGFTGNGSSSYIDTNFNPTTSGANYQLNNASRYVYLFAASGTLSLDGVITNNENRMIRDSTSSQRINAGNTNTNTPAINFTATAQMKSIHRTDASNITAYNGTTATNATQTSVNIPNQNQVVLRAGAFYGAHSVSMYAMGESLISENTNFVNSFNTYLAAL